ncbi:MAG: cation-translocating P-type ATPase, partial [Verrucomicrobiae bacterium]|nr:cation-translocating P-type ATPase [Verrucomicrobiae bacterium]
TGTLTVGKPAVTDVVAVPSETDDEQLLAVTAAVERSSEHPLARAIVAEATARGVTIPRCSAFQAQVGAGATAEVGGRVVHIGSRTYFSDDLEVDLGPLAGELDRLETEGKTLVLVGTSDAVQGVIALRDNLRPEARDALGRLRAVGVERIVMLTGDNERTARAISARLGLDQVFAELKPEGKVSRIKQIQEQHGSVAMVGDGINDAPALATADVGIAIGTGGTDAAIEAADIALLADDLTKVAEALQLGRRATRISRQNLIFSVILLAVLIPSAVVGLLSVVIAVAVHEIAELLAVSNGVRAARKTTRHTVEP